MNWLDSLTKSIEIQKLGVDISEIPVTIYLKSNGDILNFCYLEEESDDKLIVSQLTKRGTEEIRIINKYDISYVSLIYQSIIIKDLSSDVMFN